MRVLLVLCLVLVAPVSRACETALLLSIDVSQSIDVSEYRLQVDGLADALRDPEIVDILVRDNVALSVLQWSGPDAQQVTIPWLRIRTAFDVRALSDRTRAMQRAFVMSNTAPAEALDTALRQFGPVADCRRKVIDISGDGTANAGAGVAPFRRRAERLGITVNAIAIEGLGVAITNYYARKIITRDGFVMTARGHRDYPRAIRAKILREISRVIS